MRRLNASCLSVALALAVPVACTHATEHEIATMPLQDTATGTVTTPGAVDATDPRYAPEAVVQRQLEAYNAQDLDAFLATYDPQIELFAFPDRLILQGLAPMRARYAARFRDNPDLHADIPRRIVQGRYVVDHEVLTGLASGEGMAVVAIYEVIDGRIRRVWFLQ